MSMTAHRRLGGAVLAALAVATLLAGPAGPAVASAQLSPEPGSDQPADPPVMPSWVASGARPISPRLVFPDALTPTLRRLPADGLGPLGLRSPARFVAAAGDYAGFPLPPGVLLTPLARADLMAGLVDPRLLSLLADLGTRHALVVAVFRTGHSKYVAGTTEPSNHFYGRAADIVAVDGEPVSRHSVAAKDLVRELIGLSIGLRASELGQPWPQLHGEGVFSDAAHQDHLHLGFYASDGSRGP